MKPHDHRLLFNADCDCLFYQAKWNHWKPKRGGRHSVAAIRHFVDLLADNGVDTFLINPNGQRAYYPSRAIPYVWEGYRRGDRSFFYGHILGQPMTHQQTEEYLTRMTRWADRYLDLREAGVNWLSEAIAHCRRRRLHPWVSVRMNDMHGANSFAGSFMNAPLLADPRYRLRGIPPNPRDGINPYYQALNFEKRPVRDYLLRLIRELVEDYDTAGLELDWTRTYFCCNPVASPAAVDRITDWHADIRRLTRAKERRTRRPFPLGLRVPAALDLLRAFGLDVRAMARRGLIDFLVPTNTWQTTWDLPYDRWRAEFGDQIALYGCLEDAPNWVTGYNPRTRQRPHVRYLSASAPLLRGNAAGKLVLGADGIETFNFFCTDTWEDAGGDYAALRGLDDLANLRSRPKHYALSTGPACWTEPVFEYPLQLPVTLEPQWIRAFRLSLCAEPGKTGYLILQLVVEKPADQPAGTSLPPLGVSFNGSWPNYEASRTDRLLFPVGSLTHHVPEYTAWNYRFPLRAIRDGWNEVVVVNGGRQRETPAQRRAGSATIVSIELAVR